MRFTFDIAHSNSVMTKYAQYPRTVSIKQTLSVDLPEVSGDEAPIAVTWQSRHGPRHTRWHSCRHYRMVSVQTHGSDVGRILSAVSEGFPPDGVTKGYMDFPHDNSYEIDDRRIVQMDQEASAAALRGVRDWEDDCLVIDGELHLACSVPRLLLAHTGISISTDKMFPERRLGGMLRPHEASASNWFENERFDLGDEQAAMRAAGVWFGGGADILPHFEIILPQSLPVSPSGPRLVEAALAFMDTLDDYNKTRSTHPSLLRTAADLADLIWDREPQEIDEDGLGEALETALTTIARADPEGRLYTRAFVSRVEEAVRRHFDSEIGIEPSPAGRAFP